MVKKLLTLALGLVLTVGAMAQMGPGNPTVQQSAIQFWTGTGTNRAVIAVTWEDDNEDMIGIAWGVQWNGGSIMLKSLMDTIAAYDSRFTMTYTTWVSNLSYVDTANGFNLIGIDGWWWYNWKNSSDVSYSSIGVTSDMVQNGDFVDWMQMGTADTMIMATDPNGSTTPVEATIAFSDILYWVGSGANEAVLAVNWADTALAWGYRWDGSATVESMMADIAAADPRFSYSGSGWLNDITFNDGVVSLAGTPGNYWASTNNGVMDMGMGQTLADGDLEKWGDPAAGVIIDSMEYSGVWYYTYAYPMTIHPVSVPDTATAPVEATIAFSDILYWVGSGANEAVLAVNWADTALAWGYRWDGSATVESMMADIAAADPRFSYSGSGWLNDITFNDGVVSLAGTPGNYWGSTNNGIVDMGMTQTLADGDLEKWGDPAAGVIIDSMEYSGVWYYTYAYPMTIHPVSVPYVPGPFCGAVGTEGCDAISAESSAIVAWATGCTVTRGPQDISDADSPLANFGTENNAIGQATTTTTRAISLGDGGSAVLTFEKPITNGEGPDFAVFENAIRSIVTGGYFLELAFVEVSSDGERFVRFPATSLTATDEQLGTYGEIDPTYINNLAGKYEVGYGTPFDLAELADSTGIDINSITHVRVVDVVGSIDPQYATYDAFGHIVNDPWPTPFGSSGFDLTGVAVMHQNTEGVEDVDAADIAVYPNPATEQLTVSGAAGSDAVLYDMTGRLIGSWKIGSDHWQLQVSGLTAGVYMLRVGTENHRIVKK